MADKRDTEVMERIRSRIQNAMGFLELLRTQNGAPMKDTSAYKQLEKAIKETYV